MTTEGIVTDPKEGDMEPRSEAAERLIAWAGSVKRLIESAPIRAVVEEVGIAESGHSTPPERRAIRDQAQAIVDRWLERDLVAIEEARRG